jgi:hypothetical protein
MIIRRWAEYFDELLNTNKKYRSKNITTLEIQENLEPMPTLEEVEAALKKLGNNKAPGAD